jgi:hypothetical protein
MSNITAIVFPVGKDPIVKEISNPCRPPSVDTSKSSGSP